MHQNNISNLRKRIQQAPTSPGVYRWLNTKGDVLYIGKAKNLKNRLKSYVKKEPDTSLGPWKLSLIKHMTDFDVTITSNELEALILETNMIKEVKPKYNVMMKDDKNYVYIRVSNDDYPVLSIVRQMEKDDTKYFGPYLSAYNIKRTLNTLHDVFHFRSCNLSTDALNRGNQPKRACLEYQIGQCNGLCVGSLNQKQYIERIEAVMRFLKGDHRDAVVALKDMMEDAAENKKFEKAGKLRDTLIYIESLDVPQVVSDTSRENTDAIGIALQGGKAQVVILRERNGRLVEERSIVLAGEADSISAVIAELLPQYYSVETDIPDLILIQEDIEDIAVLEAWLVQIREKSVEIRAPERGKKSKLLALAQSNAKQKVSQQFAKWEAAAQNIETALKELKDTLNIEDDLKRIEGYDISHLGGTETVGSMVVIKNGKPANKEYRSFTIRTVKEGEIDDCKALKEVLSRRLRYLSNEEQQWNEKGIHFGKAKKAEQKDIETIMKDHPDDFHMEGIDYKDFMVGRDDKEIVTFVRMFAHKGDILELKSLWVKPELQGNRLGQFLSRKMIQKAKKQKVYVTIHPDLESYYAELGFRYVREPPKVLAEEIEEAKKKGGEFSEGFAMVSLPGDHKEDTSLSSTPDLLVIDGGKGQLSTVVEVLKDLKLEIPVIGLAKREEEIFLPGESFPIDLPNNSQASFLLQRLRNEAHRFANAHREKRIAKGMIGSALDDVPGIGEKTKKELLQKFGSVDFIKAASDESLLSVLSSSQLAALRGSL